MSTRALITGIAVLLLATGTAHADDGWTAHRTCTVYKNFDESTDSRIFVSGKTVTVTLELSDLLELQKNIPILKRCTAFWQCVADREAGKVKHCYENDKRWR
jgi:hypothetical protein